MVILDDKRDVETFAGDQAGCDKKSEIWSGFSHLEIHLKAHEQRQTRLSGWNTSYGSCQNSSMLVLGRYSDEMASYIDMFSFDITRSRAGPPKNGSRVF